MALRETVRRNRVRDGMVYLQVHPAAVARRDHAFPTNPPITPTVVITARSGDAAGWPKARAAKGVGVDHPAGQSLGTL